jgi:hypothetical protein
MSTQEKESRIVKETHIANSPEHPTESCRMTQAAQHDMWRVVSGAALGAVFAVISLLGGARPVTAAAKPAIAPLTAAVHMSAKRSHKTKKVKQRKIKKAGHKAGRQKKGKQHR